MAIRREEGEYSHIPFGREPGIEPQRRGRRAPRAGVRRPDDRAQHAQELDQQIVSSISEVQAARQGAGVDPRTLLVLEFDNIGFEIDESFAERFGAQIVDEREIKTGEGQRYTAVLQFSSVDAITRFQAEVAAYQERHRGWCFPISVTDCDTVAAQRPVM